jgi:hypothetical protein
VSPISEDRPDQPRKPEPRAAAPSPFPTFRAFYESLRPRTEIKEFPHEFDVKNRRPRPILERVRCHPRDLERVRRVVFEVNPWEGVTETNQIEVDDSIPELHVDVAWLTSTRTPQKARIPL